MSTNCITRDNIGMYADKTDDPEVRPEQVAVDV